MYPRANRLFIIETRGETARVELILLYEGATVDIADWPPLRRPSIAMDLTVHMYTSEFGELDGRMLAGIRAGNYR